MQSCFVIVWAIRFKSPSAWLPSTLKWTNDKSLSCLSCQKLCSVLRQENCVAVCFGVTMARTGFILDLKMAPRMVQKKCRGRPLCSSCTWSPGAGASKAWLMTMPRAQSPQDIVLLNKDSEEKGVGNVNSSIFRDSRSLFSVSGVSSGNNNCWSSYFPQCLNFIQYYDYKSIKKRIIQCKMAEVLLL